MCDFGVLVGQELAFFWVRMIVTAENGLDMARYGETTGASDVIPVKDDARKFGASPILSDGVLLLGGVG